MVGPNWPGYKASGPISSYAFPLTVGSASFFYPADRLRTNATDGGLADQTRAYFGYQTTRTSTSTKGDLSTADAHRLLYIGLGQNDNVPVDATVSTYNLSASAAIEAYSYVFTLDNVSCSVSF